MASRTGSTVRSTPCSALVKGLFGNSFDVSVGVEPMLVLHLHSLGILAQSCPFLEQNLFKCLEMFLAFVGMFFAAYVARHCNTHASLPGALRLLTTLSFSPSFGFPHKTVSGLSKFASGASLRILNLGTWLPSLTVINHHGDALAACQMQQDTHERISCNPGYAAVLRTPAHNWYFNMFCTYPHDTLPVRHIAK